MFEEATMLLVAVAIAGALLAVGAAVLAYFNPQQPADWGNALAYPLVRPLNKTHVQLGVRPLADYVEVEAVYYQHGETQTEMPIRAVAKNATWLLHGGRPAAVPCGANVTMITKYGTASRAISFAIVCLQNQRNVVETETIYTMIRSYVQFVAEHTLYRDVPVIAAFFSPGSWSVVVQNIGNGSFTYTSRASGSGLFSELAVESPLLPLEARRVQSVDTVEGGNAFFQGKYYGATGYLERWVNLVAELRGDVVKVWINNGVALNASVAPNRHPVLLWAQYMGNGHIRVGIETYVMTKTELKFTYFTVYYGKCDELRDVETFLGFLLNYNGSVLRLYYRHGGQWEEGLSVEVPCGGDDVYPRASGGWIGPFRYVVAESPQGFLVAVHDDKLYLAHRVMHPWVSYVKAMDIALNGTAVWSGWVRVEPYLKSPSTSLNLDIPLYVTPAGPAFAWDNWIRGRITRSINGFAVPPPYVNLVSSFFGVITPFKIYSVTATRLNNDAALVAYASPQCGVDNKTVPFNSSAVLGCGDTAVEVSIYKDGSSYFIDVAAGRERAKAKMCASPGCVVTVPVYYEYDVTGAYQYRLQVRIDVSHNYTFLARDMGIDFYRVEANYTGEVKLYLNGKLVSYDAIRGYHVYYEKRYNPPPSPPPAPPEVKPSCVPKYSVRPVDMYYKNFQQGANNYYVDLYVKYEIRITGCGQDEVRHEERKVTGGWSATTGFHVHDGKNTCGFQKATTCEDNVVCCKTQE